MSTANQLAAYAINGQPASTEAFYAVACDPNRSVAVEACAGAGKTWMLIERMVKALESGVESDQILAITFTKKAAGEMRDRLQKRLTEPALRPLRAKILASGRSVQISTFHAWFAQLLRAAPLSVLKDLQLPLSYELLEDESVLLPELRHAFYAAALASHGLQADFAALIEELGRSKVDEALVSLLAKRTEFELADARGLLEASVQDAEDKQLIHELYSVTAKVLGGYKTDELRTAANDIEAGLTHSNVELLFSALLTKNLTPKKYRSKISDEDRQFITEAQNDLLEILAARHQHTCWLYQQRMTRIGREWLNCFAKLKHSRGLADMADLERAVTKLLSDPELSGAVQERLDSQLRHVMIDEFQDTNPLQWQAMHAWLAGYAGSGGGQNRPSLFIVGDPKQSIYRFRRAEPRVFAAAQVFMQGAFDAVLLSCDHTRRNAQGVLSSVNAAMLNAQEANEYKGFRPHTTQSTEAGTTLSLPLIARSEASELSLKEREAEQAASWIAAHATGQSVMVLSRTHEPLGHIQQALQRYGVVASKLEKNDLADVPAVQDVLALLNFLVSPHSDLDLARALKSPLFTWSDTALMQLRARQLAALPTKLTWFDVLDGEVKNQLLRWQAWLYQLPPHDALQAIYDDGKVLQKYLACMPSAIRLSSHAALEALLGGALQTGGGRFLSAYAFVRAMRAKVQSIKAPTLKSQNADAQASDVQLLTVHGAKGLEADVVLLLASDPEPRKLQSMTTLIDWQPEHSAPQKFVFLLSESNPPACAKALLHEDLQAREVEELNTLYVAMTRARQTLVVSASESYAPNPKSVWHRLQALCQQAAADAELTISSKSPSAARNELVELLSTDHLTLPNASTEAKVDEVNPAAQRGKALHRLLQWQCTDVAALAKVQHEFSISDKDVQSVCTQANQMTTGEAAWLWDEAKIDWQANEYELVHEGRVLRIDRLVKKRATQMWWVIDFKSAVNPEKSMVLQEQLKTYRAAVSAAFNAPLSLIQLAFVTGEGWLQVLNRSVHNDE
jgi:ATP-dependent helicase/nuclease subunit A